MKQIKVTADTLEEIFNILKEIDISEKDIKILVKIPLEYVRIMGVSSEIEVKKFYELFHQQELNEKYSKIIIQRLGLEQDNKPMTYTEAINLLEYTASVLSKKAKDYNVESGS